MDPKNLQIKNDIQRLGDQDFQKLCEMTETNSENCITYFK